MRYIGSKRLLLDNILEIIKNNTTDVESILDVFAGSGIVSQHFKEHGYKIHSNDFLYFSYILTRGTLCINKKPKFKNLGFQNPIEYLNRLKFENTKYLLSDCFIYNNYSPHDNCERMYFTPENAIKIDVIRKTIEDWFVEKKINEDEYFYLLSSLIAAVPYVSNIAGVYGAYLKYWDGRAKNDLILEDPNIINAKKQSFAYNLDYSDFLNIASADLLYADPPYNSRQYLPNYHLLETIAKYDNPHIKGITGIREYSHQKSEFSQNKNVKQAFEKLLKNAKVKYVLISYNNEGLLSTEELTGICQKYAKEGTFKLFELDYRRYKSKIPNDNTGLKEQLYFFEKQTSTYYKSPLNYTGGKYRLLPQITKLFPDKIDVMVDLFAGGCDICTNIRANKIYANDINTPIIQMYKKMQTISVDETLKYIEDKIQKEGLSKENKEAYLSFRRKYNSTNNPNPLDLFILISYAFNHQCRFNNNHEFNVPFGKNRSTFNERIKNNLITFIPNIKKITFSSLNFKDFDFHFLKQGDFVYADPPYRISTGMYNDGRRGFGGWNKSDDKALFDILDNLNSKGIKFALSNITEHKGNKNQELIEWMKKYNVHYINTNYNNSSYNVKKSIEQTVEVLVTNY